jgi:hypothetical protein
MSVTPSPFQSLIFTWQPERRLRSGDRLWILTDTESYYSSMYGRSTPQRFYKVGGLDLRTEKLGYFLFTQDDARAILRCGLDAAPWEVPQVHGIELTRFYHGSNEQGRFRERVSLVPLEPELAAQGSRLRAYFERHLSFRGNATPGMWQDLECRAGELRAIEKVALSMTDWFAAGDVKARVGNDVNVTRVLRLLVDEGRLITNGRKRRWCRYQGMPCQVVERSDWTG